MIRHAGLFSRIAKIAVVWFLVWFYGYERHFQQYFSSIMAVSFIGGGNWNTRRKPPTCRKSLINWEFLDWYCLLD